MKKFGLMLILGVFGLFGVANANWNPKTQQCEMPKEVKDRLEKYLSEATSDEEWNNINQGIVGMVKDYWKVGHKWENRCSVVTKAYNEISKEFGTPRTRMDEGEMIDKIHQRFYRYRAQMEEQGIW